MYTTAKKCQRFAIAPLIVLGVMAVFYAVFGIFPFGKNTVSWCDMTQQTVPLLMNFKDVLEGNGSLFYSTGNAGGMNFWGVFLFFLASPLYLTVGLVEKENIIYLVNILLAVKLALAAFTASVYFNKSHKKLKNEFCVVLSVMYGLCGYGIMYCQTLVWLDIMILFPLLVLSVERMCKQGKSLMYGVVLSIMMIISFYLSFMLVIYLLVAVPLFILLRCRKYERKKAAFLFLLTSLISALVTAPVWLCAFLQTSASARNGETFMYLMFKPLFENMGNKLAVIMSTALCIAMLPFFIKNKISKRTKVKYNLVLLVFLAIPLIFDPVNKMWHTGNYQSFPLRYGFVIIFILLSLTACYFENISAFGNNSKGFVIVTSAMVAAFIGVSIYVVISKKNELSSYINTLRVSGEAFKLLIVLSVFAYMIYIICIFLQRKKLIGSKTMSLLMLAVFIGECATSLSVNLGYAVNDGGVLRTSAVLQSENSNEAYYRTKTEKKYLHVNMLGGLGYNSLAHYTSLTGEDYMFTMKKLGYSSYWMEVGSNGGTALTDALLAVKKSIGAYFDFMSYYDITSYDGDLEIGESSICCPVGIVSEKTPKFFETVGNGSRVDTQRLLAENYFGTDDMIYEYTPDFTSGGEFGYENSKYTVTLDDEEKGLCQMRYSIEIKGHQALYFDIFQELSNNLTEKYYSSASIYVNGNNIISDYPGQKNNGIITLGEFEDTTAEILVVFKKDIAVKSMGVFGIELDRLQQCTDNVRGCDFHIDGSNLNAEYEAEKEQYLYMSIPYDKGMKAYINGEEAELIKVNDAFCALKLQKGKNIIQLRFLPYGMSVAVILTIIGLLLLSGVHGKAFKRINEAGLKVIYSLSLRLTGIMFGAIILFVYIAPIVIRLTVVASAIFK